MLRRLAFCTLYWPNRRDLKVSVKRETANEFYPHLIKLEPTSESQAYIIMLSAAPAACAQLIASSAVREYFFFNVRNMNTRQRESYVTEVK
jgi:hypothetical protein